MKGLTIGKIAKQTGVNAVTLRFYEQCGLIPKANRTPAGYRMYPENLVEQVKFVKNAKTAGFSLAEISELSELVGFDTNAHAPQEKVSEKLVNVTEKMQALKKVQKHLESLVD